MERTNAQKILYYLIAEMEAAERFKRDGTWHVDCPCEECNNVRAWRKLSWWKRLKAKLEL